MSLLEELRDFLMKANLIEVAIGLILALAFKTVVDSLVENVLTPIVAAVVGQPDFRSLAIDVGDARITYGLFLNAVISFLVIGVVLFLVVKAYNRMVAVATRRGETEETPSDAADVVLLREIRDLLQQRPGG